MPSRSDVAAIFCSRDGVIGLAGFTTTAMRFTRGRASCSNSSCFASTSGAKNVSPVMLPPGLARPSTSPVASASPEIAITIGIVVVAFFAASVAGVPPVTSRSTLERTISPASCPRRS